MDRSLPHGTTAAAASGRSVTASVWVLLVLLARLGVTDVQSREASGRLDDLQPLLTVFEVPVGGLDGTFFPMQVWKFLKGEKLDPTVRVANLKLY